MTWNDLLRIEVTRLHAQEEDVAPTLARLQERLLDERSQGVLQGLIEEAPARQARLAMVCGIAGWTLETRSPLVLVGWQEDVEDLVDTRPKSYVVDALILTLVLKITRMRTSCYEAAYLLASNLDAPHLANLLYAPWVEDVDADSRAAQALSRLIANSPDEGRAPLGLD